MRARRRPKAEAVQSKPVIHPPEELAGMEPDSLAKVIRETLTSLTDDELTLLCRRIVADLRRSRLHVGACLFMLGITATIPDELTPSDIAHLVRYVRINQPQLMEVVAQPIAAQFHAPLSVIDRESSARAA